MTGKKQAKINLGGKERTFYFGLGFLGLFIEKTGVSMDSLQDFMKKNPFKAIPQMMFYSLAYGYVRQDLEPDFNIYVVTEWIDDDGGGDGPAVKEFLDAFNGSMGIKLPVNETVKKNRAQRRKPAKKTL